MMQGDGSLLCCHYLDILSPDEIRSIDAICFSVPYVLHALIIVPFLNRNGIEPLRSKRNVYSRSGNKGIRVVVGGSAIHPLHCLDDIVDEQFLGEYEGDTVSLDPKTTHIKENRFSRREEIDSEVYIMTDKYRGILAPLNENIVIKEAVVELARGCPNSCQFCEYRWIVGGKYREKSFWLLERQLETLHPEAFKKGQPKLVKRLQRPKVVAGSNRQPSPKSLHISQKLVKRLTVRTSNLSACTYTFPTSQLCVRSSIGNFSGERFLRWMLTG